MKFAPVAVFVYNRIWHTQQTIEALQKNVLAMKSELFIFSDGPRNSEDARKVRDVRNYIHEIRGFKKVTIRKRQKNLGLANSIMAGVTEIVNTYGDIIVLEDDLIVSRGFLTFMNKSLFLYKNNKNVGMISGYVFPLQRYPETPFFLLGGNCWGWGTWKRAWNLLEKNPRIILSYVMKNNVSDEFDFQGYAGYIEALKNIENGTAKTWAVLWYGTQFVNHLYGYHPRCSLVQNIGFDGSGEHCNMSIAYRTKTITSAKVVKVPVCENRFVRKQLIEFHRTKHPSVRLFIQKVISKLKWKYNI